MTSKPPAPSDLADKFMLRLPDGMRDRLKEEAAKNNRSMNAEIVTRLRHTFEADRIDQAAFGPNVDPSKRALLEAAMELLRRVDEDLEAEAAKDNADAPD